jgi:hypothetical protein
VVGWWEKPNELKQYPRMSNALTLYGNDELQYGESGGLDSPCEGSDVDYCPHTRLEDPSASKYAPEKYATLRQASVALDFSYAALAPLESP